MTRVIFAGTPAFARENLRALIEAGVRPVAVLTQPDRPAGRGKKLTPGPVKIFAREQGIDVIQPETLRDPAVISTLDAFEADLLIVVAYGLLLPQAVLDLPRVACLNVHASLLPRWRGAAPIQHAILAGDEQTGISLTQMDAGLDTGPVYASAAIDIGPGETAGDLHDRLADLGGKLLAKHLDAIASGDAVASPQDENDATCAAKIRTSDARIDWSGGADEVLRTIRAYNPVPGAWSELNGERIKCWTATRSDGEGAVPGQIIGVRDDGIDVACGDGTVRLQTVQRPGRNRIQASGIASQTAAADRIFVSREPVR